MSFAFSNHLGVNLKATLGSDIDTGTWRSGPTGKTAVKSLVGASDAARVMSKSGRSRL